MATSIIGVRNWTYDEDNEGHRTYTITFIVKGVPGTDGPAAVRQTTGLPTYGGTWAWFGDTDNYAYLKRQTKIAPHEAKEGEPTVFWAITFTYSTKPDKECRTSRFEDPLLEPVKFSGGYKTISEEKSRDRHNNPIVTSSHELIRGQQNEWEDGTPFINVEQNVASLDAVLCTSLMTPHHVNSVTMWGFAARCVKLSDFTWEKKYYGTCSVYYTRKFKFEVDYRTFDRDLLDEGTKVLRGHWDTSTGDYLLDAVGGLAPDYLNPRHFIRYVDMSGNASKVILDGQGAPATLALGTGTSPLETSPGYRHVEYYPEADLLTLLNLPATF